MSERNKYTGRALPLLPSDFFDTETGAPLTVSEFVQLWRERGGDEGHLAAILNDLGERAEDYAQSASLMLH